MQYEVLGTGANYPYPDFSVPPDQKDKNWCMTYAKAAWADFCYAYPKGVFANNGGDYEKFRMYALGKQPVSPYKKWLGVEQQTDNTWLSIDWSIRSIVSQYRDKAISRLMKEDYGIVCTPIDMLAKSESDSYYNKMKAKMAVRELMIKQQPELADHPMLSIAKGEPVDMDELEMRMQQGEQFNRSKDAEMAIDLGFYENNYKQVRKAWHEDLFDYGVAGYCESLGDDNKAKFRRVNPECVVVSYCKDSTFKDAVHAGEVKPVSLVDLALVKDEEGNPVFSEKELTEFAGSIAGKFGNPMMLGRGAGFLYKPYDKFKCNVLEIYFFTYNDQVYYETQDDYGNSDFRKIMDTKRGKTSAKYKRKRIQYVYKCSWVVGTDKCYDWGMCYDQKRSTDTKKKAMTSLPYKFCAYNFYEMRCQGFMERLIPYLDDYQLTMLKIQNFKNRAVPSGWWIDLDGLERVALNKGGKNMTPKELLEMFFQTGLLVGRSTDPTGQPQNQNWKPIIPIENSVMAELVGFFQDLQNTVIAIEKMTGYNDVTSGNPNPKTLVPGYEIANQATQDALYPMAYAEEYLTLSLSEDVLCRMKQGIAKGAVTGYAPYSSALGTNTLRFIELDESMSLRDYGIVLQKRTTEQEKMWIMTNVQEDIRNGFLDTSSAILILNTHNAKQAMQILSYRVQKAKESANQQQLMQIEMNNEGQMKQQAAAQQAKMQELELDAAFKYKIKQAELMAQIQMNRDKLASAERQNLMSNQTKLAVSNDTGEAKVTSTAVAGELAKQKQQIANEKKETSTI